MIDEVLDVNIYITEKDFEEASSFRAEIRKSALFLNKKVFFIRPNLGQILEEHTLGLIDARAYSSSLIVFCGSPVLSQTLAEKKTSIELFSAVTGNASHTLQFESEIYGGPKKAQLECAKKKEFSPPEAWEVIRRSTLCEVYTKRIETIFDEESNWTEGYKSKGEMIKSYRDKGNGALLRRRHSQHM